MSCQFQDPIYGRTLRIDRCGDRLRIKAARGTLTPKLKEWLRVNKQRLLELIPQHEPADSDRVDPPLGMRWMTPAEYKAKMLNELFNALGGSKRPSRITARTVAHGERFQRKPARVGSRKEESSYLSK